jgi:tetratricopeptide (TPR) repeat protein
MAFVDRYFFAKLLSASSLATVLFVSGDAAVFAEDAKAAEDPNFKKAVALYGNASYSEAASQFDKLTGSKQNGEVARYYRALCYQQQKQYKAAKDEYLYLYYKAQDKNVRYKAWQALKTLPQNTVQTTRTTAKNTVAREDGPGVDAWGKAGENYGRTGPEAISEVTVTIIPTSCGRRRR